MTKDAPAERYELMPGQTLTLEVRRDPVLWTGLVLAVAAVLVALVALAVAVKADPPASSSSTSSAAAVVAAPVAYRGPAVIRHKARQCYTIRDDAGRVLYRKCSVRWVQDVRKRSTLEQFRARYATRA